MTGIAYTWLVIGGAGTVSACIKHDALSAWGCAALFLTAVCILWHNRRKA